MGRPKLLKNQAKLVPFGLVLTRRLDEKATKSHHLGRSLLWPRPLTWVNRFKPKEGPSNCYYKRWARFQSMGRIQDHQLATLTGREPISFYINKRWGLTPNSHLNPLVYNSMSEHLNSQVKLFLSVFLDLVCFSLPRCRS